MILTEMKIIKMTGLLLALSLLLLFAGCGRREASPPAESASSGGGAVSQPGGAESGAEEGPGTASSFAPQQAAEPVYYTGSLELPVAGASGYAPGVLTLRAEPSDSAAAVETLEPGQGFTVLEESGEWWRVCTDNSIGWLPSKYCLINLPDVIPSIVYDNTNAYASLFKTSGEEIPGVTGQALYQSKTYNPRLQKEEYTVAVLYGMAKKIYAAQQLALAEGNTLIIYEGFRPYDVQVSVAEALEKLITDVPSLRAGVESDPWSINWFIAQGVSNHQQGYAIDVTIGKITGIGRGVSGGYAYNVVTSYEEYSMPTPMHELSLAAASLSKPVLSTSLTAWQEVAPAASMNEAALTLRDYCVAAGMTPLASEWWHFNDLDCLSVVDKSWQGKFTLSRNYSQPAPAAEEG